MCQRGHKVHFHLSSGYPELEEPIIVFENGYSLLGYIYSTCTKAKYVNILVVAAASGE